jgi:hypothetical protein
VTTRKPVGVQVTTPPGARQGFSISGRILYVLTGATNQPARVDTYSFATGEQTGTRDITRLGADRAGSHREPEGAYGNMVGIKAGTGDQRRLLVYSMAAATNTADGSLGGAPAGKRGSNGLTPRAAYARTQTLNRWGCGTHPAPCIRTIGGYANRNIGGTNVKSDHASGNAVDIMVSAANDRQLGDEIANFFQANERPMNVKYIIWNRRIWSPQRAGEGWRPYSGASAHTDHVHVSVKSGADA